MPGLKEREEFLTEIHSERSRLSKDNMQALENLRELQREEAIIRNIISELKGKAESARITADKEESRLAEIMQQSAEIKREYNERQEEIDVGLIPSRFSYDHFLFLIPSLRPAESSNVSACILGIVSLAVS